MRVVVRDDKPGDDDDDEGDAGVVVVGFDYVRVRVDGESIHYDYDEFTKLPLSDRIRALLAGQPVFMFNGKEITKVEALGPDIGAGIRRAAKKT